MDLDQRSGGHDLPEGGLRYADGIVSDITERKKSEEAVRKSEERFHLIARATNDVIWDWDLATNNLWWNESFKIIFGYTTGRSSPESSPGQPGFTPRTKNGSLPGHTPLSSMAGNSGRPSIVSAGPTEVMQTFWTAATSSMFKMESRSG